MRIKDTTFAIIDTETNGSKPDVARPVQVSVLLMKNGENLGQKTWLINPEARIPPDAAGFHQITNEMVKNAPTREQARPEIEEFIGDAIPVSYKAPFHSAMLPFIKREWICCHKLARHSFEHGETNEKGVALTDHGDQYLRYWLGLKIDTGDIPCHNAESDVKTFAGIFTVAVGRYLENGFVDDAGAFITFSNQDSKLAKISSGPYRDTPIEKVETKWLRDQVFGLNKKEISLEPDLEFTIRDEYAKRTLRIPQPNQP